MSMQRVVHGNTEIIIRDRKQENERGKKKVAIRISPDMYDFIVKHYGERGFTQFYEKAGREYIKKLLAEYEGDGRKL